MKYIKGILNSVVKTAICVVPLAGDHAFLYILNRIQHRSFGDWEDEFVTSAQRAQNM